MSNADAHLDLRLPIGGLFTTLGGVLGGFGLLTGGDASRYVKSEGINLNLWWGAALLVTGLLFLITARPSASGARRG